MGKANPDSSNKTAKKVSFLIVLSFGEIGKNWLVSIFVTPAVPVGIIVTKCFAELYPPIGGLLRALTRYTVRSLAGGYHEHPFPPMSLNGCYTAH